MENNTQFSMQKLCAVTAVYLRRLTNKMTNDK